ncbi:pentatricopeptide repeat-containing protein [Tanacetum coccineum]
MKPWVDIIRENSICLGGHKDHVSACLCHMLYCIETSTRYNLAFFILKRLEKTRSKPKELLLYGMILTRLFKHVVSVFPELAIDRYISHDRVMHPLAPHYERKTRSDRGKKRSRKSNASFSSTTLNHPSSSHPLDDTIDENYDVLNLVSRHLKVSKAVFSFEIELKLKIVQALRNKEVGGSGSGSKKRTYIPREREEAEQRLLDDYFGDEDTHPKYPEEILGEEAFADQTLWIWHAYFGVLEANNDLSVSYGSPLFDDLLADKAH